MNRAPEEVPVAGALTDQVTAGVVYLESEGLVCAGLAWCREELQLGQDFHGEVACSGAIGVCMALEAAEEGALILDVDGAHSSRRPR